MNFGRQAALYREVRPAHVMFTYVTNRLFAPHRGVNRAALVAIGLRCQYLVIVRAKPLAAMVFPIVNMIGGSNRMV